ncbi:MAG: hypothetical protein WAN43_06125 [Rhodomicrobium sp.]|jgi:hypothetical protein
MSREQEENELASEGLAPKKPAAGTPAAAPHREEAVYTEAPEVADEIPPAAEPAPAAPVFTEPAAAAKKPVNPNRRALPPIGTGRRPGEEPAKRRRLRGILRLFVEVLFGGLVGAGIGYGAVRYLHIPPEQLKLYVGGAAGGGALLFGFWGLLHFD